MCIFRDVTEAAHEALEGIVGVTLHLVTHITMLRSVKKRETEIDADGIVTQDENCLPVVRVGDVNEQGLLRMFVSFFFIRILLNDNTLQHILMLLFTISAAAWGVCKTMLTMEKSLSYTFHRYRSRNRTLR